MTPATRRPRPDASVQTQRPDASVQLTSGHDLGPSRWTDGSRSAPVVRGGNYAPAHALSSVGTRGNRTGRPATTHPSTYPSAAPGQREMLAMASCVDPQRSVSRPGVRRTGHLSGTFRARPWV